METLAPNKTQRLELEALCILSTATAPMTAGDLYRASTSDTDSIVFKAVGNLARAGLVEVAGNGLSPKGQVCKSYRLTAQGRARLMAEHLVPDLGASDPTPKPAPVAIQAPEPPPEPAVVQAPDPARTDPVICAIDRLTEPHWVDGPMHAQRLHRLADAPLMAKQPDVRAWLTDLANIIEELT